MLCNVAHYVATDTFNIGNVLSLPPILIAMAKIWTFGIETVATRVPLPPESHVCVYIEWVVALAPTVAASFQPPEYRKQISNKHSRNIASVKHVFACAKLRSRTLPSTRDHTPSLLSDSDLKRRFVQVSSRLGQVGGVHGGAHLTCTQTLRRRKHGQPLTTQLHIYFDPSTNLGGQRMYEKSIFAGTKPKHHIPDTICCARVCALLVVWACMFDMCMAHASA